MSETVKLYEKLAAVNPELPYIALLLMGPCDNCTCGFKEEIEAGHADAKMFREHIEGKIEIVEQSFEGSVHTLLTHPEVVSELARTVDVPDAEEAEYEGLSTLPILQLAVG